MRCPGGTDRPYGLRLRGDAAHSSSIGRSTMRLLHSPTEQAVNPAIAACAAFCRPKEMACKVGCTGLRHLFSHVRCLTKEMKCRWI